jgi:hypothetical protein
MQRKRNCSQIVPRFSNPSKHQKSADGLAITAVFGLGNVNDMFPKNQAFMSIDSVGAGLYQGNLTG